jgi:hypothetical protein
MKETNPEVVIVMARCSHEKAGFGLRFEKKGHNKWFADWAFAVKESTARKERYDTNTISGSIILDRHYPGCPYCKSMQIVRCGICNKVSCYDGRHEIIVCPWCNNKSKIGGRITHLDSGGDR